tara:strand:+ start:606 stop:1091 length:486 start_codon:yes stop_codon:yes gene_type:complete
MALHSDNERHGPVSTNELIMAVVFIVVPIASGAIVYVGWRSTDLLVFDWLAWLGIPEDVFRPDIQLPRWLLYSFPDGCWVFAGTSWMLLIWRRLHAWVYIFAVLGIGGEIGQGLGYVPGTFDWNDISFYVGGFLLSYLGYEYAKTRFIDGRFTGHGGACCG